MADRNSLDELLQRLGQAVEKNEGRWSTVFEDAHWTISRDAETNKLLIKDLSGATWSEATSSQDLQVYWSENDQPCDDQRWIDAHQRIIVNLADKTSSETATAEPDYSFLKNKKARYQEATRMKNERNWDPED